MNCVNVAKKNVLLRPLYNFGRYTGPPPVTPNSFCFSMETVGAKKVLASKSLFRRYSNASPWNSLVPDLLINDMNAPPVSPYSAATLLTTLNSAMVSTEGGCDMTPC